MKTIEQVGNDALKEHLLKNWMTHDAMWWLDLAGIRYETIPKIEGCIQHTLGECTGEVRLFFD